MAGKNLLLGEGAYGAKEMAMKQHETLGSRLRAARVGRGLAQADLAAELSVSAPTISDWENDKKVPTFDRRPQIAMALGKDIDDLFPNLTAIEEDVGQRPVVLKGEGGFLGSIARNRNLVKNNIQSANVILTEIEKHIASATASGEGVSGEIVGVYVKLLKSFLNSMQAEYTKEFDLGMSIIKDGAIYIRRDALPDDAM